MTPLPNRHERRAVVSDLSRAERIRRHDASPFRQLIDALRMHPLAFAEFPEQERNRLKAIRRDR